jgi:hypothetical protein
MIQNSRIIWFFVVLISSVLLFNNVTFSEDDVNLELVNKFIQDAPIRWKQYLISLKNCEGNIEEKLTRTGDARPMNSESNAYEISQCHFTIFFPNITCCVLEAGKVVQIESSNKRYFFRLNSDGSKNWTISDAEMHTSIPSLGDWYFPDKRSINWKKFSAYKIADYTSQGLLLAREWLPILIQLDEFKIIKFKSIFENNIRMVQMAYEFEPKNNTVIGIRSGEIFLMPDNYWLVKRGKCYFDSPSDINGRYSITWENEYTLNKDNIPLLVQRNDFCSLADKKETKTWTRTTIFSLNEIFDKNSERFTLSAYGFPEPDFDNSRRTSANRVRYILMGLGAIIIVIALWRMIQRRRRKM